MNSGPLQEQQMVLISDPSLTPAYVFSVCVQGIIYQVSWYRLSPISSDTYLSKLGIF